jgi:hypothetical protein
MTRQQRLKVWVGNYDGRRELLIAATSKKRVCELFPGLSLNHMKGYFRELTQWEKRNKARVELALANPEVGFVRKILAREDVPWERLE